LLPQRLFVRRQQDRASRDALDTHVMALHLKQFGYDMFSKSALWALLAATLTLSCVGSLLAQVPGEAQGTAPPVYRPSFGDLMTTAIQPRHVKLGLAGQEGNWEYAAYELRELQGAFRRIGQAVPTYRSNDMAALIDATTSAPIEDVATAIKKGDANRFAVAYGQLTATCNACHQSTGHAAVVIQVPRASSYPDQDFRPQQP
jgi:cytochrome c553